MLSADQLRESVQKAGVMAADVEKRDYRLTTGFVGVALASFMQVLDLTIANVSLPAITGNLGGSGSQATWVITSFAVSNAIALPLTGFLTRRFGERKLIMWATALFSMERASEAWPELSRLAAGGFKDFAKTKDIRIQRKTG